jgi:hypothetical protein
MERVELSYIAVRGLAKKVSFMTANRMTPFEAFRSFIEFYPRLSATIAFGTMAAAAKMIPSSGAANGGAAQISETEELVLPAATASPRKRSTVHKARRATIRKTPGSTARKAPRKISKRLTARRRKAA